MGCLSQVPGFTPGLRREKHETEPEGQYHLPQHDVHAASPGQEFDLRSDDELLAQACHSEGEPKTSKDCTAAGEKVRGLHLVIGSKIKVKSAILNQRLSGTRLVLLFPDKVF